MKHSATMKTAMLTAAIAMTMTGPLAVTAKAGSVKSGKYCHNHWNWKKFRQDAHCHCYHGVREYGRKAWASHMCERWN